MAFTTTTPPPLLPDHPSPDDPVLNRALMRALVVHPDVPLLDQTDRADAWSVLLWARRRRRATATPYPQDAA